jgi:lipid-binding SYLF domain-containing protein
MHNALSSLAAVALASLLGIAPVYGQSGNNNDNSQNANASANINPAQQLTLAYHAAGVLLGQLQRPKSQRMSPFIINHAHCIAVFPEVFKEGLIAVGTNGNGIVACRDKLGGWNASAPGFITLSGGSLGFQAGASTTEIVMLFMTKKAINQLMNGNVKVGAHASVAAGPVGLQANAHTAPAPLIVYRIAQSGGYAGAKVKGVTISAAHQANCRLYGHHSRYCQGNQNGQHRQNNNNNNNNNNSGQLLETILFKLKHAPKVIQVYNKALATLAPESKYKPHVRIQKKGNNSNGG